MANILLFASAVILVRLFLIIGFDSMNKHLGGKNFLIQEMR